MNKFWKSGDPFVWLTGGALAASLLMILGLVLLILINGLGQFWPDDLSEVILKNDQKLLGEIWEREAIPSDAIAASDGIGHRIRMKIGNRDLYALDFRWVDESDIARIERPANALAMERIEWGNFYGYFKAVKMNDAIIESALSSAWPRIQTILGDMNDLRDQIREIEKDEIGAINYKIERHRLSIRKTELQAKSEESTARITELQNQVRRLEDEYEIVEKRLESLSQKSRQYFLTMATADGREKDINLFDVVRIYQPNSMNAFNKSGFYTSKVWEFVTGEPRESNTEGGIFPAIFGTVMMVMIMSIMVVPFGVVAAVYLREYAKQGFFVRLVRIAVNNLAGVPSIVYGVFGLGFFIYAIGGTIDQLFYPEALPTPTFGTGGILWASLTLSLLTVPVVIVATEEGLAAVPREIREGSLALAATKFETLWRIVVPSAMPGILTGLILAVARAAGEVAPLMITGVVKLAPTLPLDSYFPFLHLERKFMHLGFHIYDVGFQSPNVEAAIPMVYSTTLLLLLIVIFLNIFAIFIRNRLRKKLAYGVF